MKVEEFIAALEDQSRHKVLSKMKLEDIDLMVNTAAQFIQKARFYVQKLAPPVPPAPKTEPKKEAK